MPKFKEADIALLRRTQDVVVAATDAVVAYELDPRVSGEITFRTENRSRVTVTLNATYVPSSGDSIRLNQEDTPASPGFQGNCTIDLTAIVADLLLNARAANGWLRYVNGTWVWQPDDPTWMQPNLAHELSESLQVWATLSQDNAGVGENYDLYGDIYIEENDGLGVFADRGGLLVGAYNTSDSDPVIFGIRPGDGGAQLAKVGGGVGVPGERITNFTKATDADGTFWVGSEVLTGTATGLVSKGTGDGTSWAGTSGGHDAAEAAWMLSSTSSIGRVLLETATQYVVQVYSVSTWASSKGATTKQGAIHCVESFSADAAFVGTQNGPAYLLDDINTSTPTWTELFDAGVGVRGFARGEQNVSVAVCDDGITWTAVGDPTVPGNWAQNPTLTIPDSGGTNPDFKDVVAYNDVFVAIYHQSTAGIGGFGIAVSNTRGATWGVIPNLLHGGEVTHRVGAAVHRGWIYLAHGAVANPELGYSGIPLFRMRIPRY